MKLKHRDHKENRLNGKKGQRYDIPDPDDSFLAHPLVQLPKKESISIRLDSDVIQWFRSKGRGYQTKINHLLRAYVEAQTKHL